MPRQSRPIPFRLNRFNYFNSEVVNPLWHRKGIIARPSRAGDNTHRLYRADFLKFLKEPSSVVAIQDYLEGDKLSRMDKDAQRALKALPPEQRQVLEAQYRCTWERKQRKRSWDVLLKEIAIDQEVFLDIFKNGPTSSGLRETGKIMSSRPEPLWEKASLSLATACRIYRFYMREINVLRGSYRIRDIEAKAWLMERGLMTSNLPPLVMAFGGNKENIYPAVAHWLHHSLRNLARYRNGHPPIPWNEANQTCVVSCARHHRQLLGP
jgi:hypothetical protein